MKKTKAPHLSISLVFIISLVCVLNSFSYADIIYESATMGPPNQSIGYVINSEIFQGSRFYIEQDVQVTAIGGHLGEWSIGNLFGAIIRLNSASDLPDGSPLYSSEVAATTVFDVDFETDDYRIPLSTVLTPGWYALVFGTDYFGALDGFGLMPFEGQTDLPDASPIVWYEGIWQNSSSGGARFVVEGIVFTPTDTKITGSKFNDFNKDGDWDVDEPAMEGWEIFLDLNNNGVLEYGEPNTITDPNGFYEFTDITPGEYYIREIMKPGWRQTLPGGDEKYTVTLDPNEVISEMDFGNCVSTSTSVSLQAIEDAYTSSFTPLQNYGMSNSLLCGRLSSSVYRSFLKFDLSSIPPEQIITSARLVLKANNFSLPNAELAVYFISSDTWNEGTITWNTMPYTQELTFADVRYIFGEVNSWDVTFDADQEYFGDGILSLEIMSRDENSELWASFWSKDVGVPDWIPVLEIEYEPAFGGGSGEPENPYLIYTAEHMNSIGLYPYRWRGHYKLMDDISLADYTDQEYNIIGTTAPNVFHGDGPFRGVFDGNNHTISDFSYSFEGETEYVGLFGYVYGATIKNLNIASPNVRDYYYEDSMRVGAIAGFADWSDIYGCSIEGGSVQGEKYVGGLVGVSNKSYIVSCQSSAEISGNSCVGGLIGSGFGILCRASDCYATGPVSGEAYVGGFIGSSSGIVILNCYSTGTVTGTTDVGGFSGYDASNFPFEDNVKNCFWDVTSSGIAVSAAGTGLDTTAMQDIDTYLNAGWDFVSETANGPSGDWAMLSGGGYPILWWQLPEAPPLPAFAGGTGAPEDPYLIATVEQLNSIGHNPQLMDKSFRLTADLDLTGIKFYPLAERPYAFTATFDGGGHAISNITFVSDTYRSCIGFLGILEGDDASIQNLTLNDPNIYVPWGNGVGSLVGKNDSATIMNCHATGVHVAGWWEVGGLVGINVWYGTISGCSTNGYITENDAYYLMSSSVGGLVGLNYNWAQIEESYARVEVLGNDYVGGLTGANMIYGTLTDCYAAGVVTGTERYVGGLIGRSAITTAENCYSSCIVTGPVETERTGGLVGGDSSGDYTGCFWDSTINPSLPGIGNATVEGVIGESTENMYKSSTYTLEGWDFIDTWDICEDTNYPKLQWQESVRGDFGCPDGVGMEDLLVFIGCWLAADLPGGQQPECTVADFNGDNEVNLPDFALFGENWLYGI